VLVLLVALVVAKICSSVPAKVDLPHAVVLLLSVEVPAVVVRSVGVAALAAASSTQFAVHARSSELVLLDTQLPLEWVLVLLVLSPLPAVDPAIPSRGAGEGQCWLAVRLSAGREGLCKVAADVGVEPAALAGSQVLESEVQGWMLSGLAELVAVRGVEESQPEG